MNFYVYCLSDEGGRGGELESLAGVAGEGVRLFECEGLTAVVSEFEGGRVAVSHENLRAHNRVLAQVLASTTPLPFRFGTLAAAEQLEDYVRKNRDALRANLARVSGCVEMSVKILWDAGRHGDSAAPASGTGETRARESGARAVGGGAAFLAAKRAALLGEEHLRARAEEIAAWADGRVKSFVRESRARVSPAEAIVVRASHLVERERLAEYKEIVNGLREERGAELRFLTSGAWPPYSFSDLAP